MICGKCREHPATLILFASGLMRCQSCFDALGLDATHARAVIVASEQTIPSSISQTVTRRGFSAVRGLAEDFKLKQAADR